MNRSPGSFVQEKDKKIKANTDCPAMQARKSDKRTEQEKLEERRKGQSKTEPAGKAKKAEEVNHVEK